MPLDGVFLDDSERHGRNLVEWAARMSTGRAQEMQKCSFEFRGDRMRWVAFGLLGISLIVGGSGLSGQTGNLIAVRCGSLFDGRGETLRKNVVVVIAGEKIKEVATTIAWWRRRDRSVG